MIAWLSAYNSVFGMPPVSVLTSVFGAFAATFAIILCWPKLVRDFGPIGGFMSAALLVGTFWLLNHKLPGFGIHPECIPDPNGGAKQFGLIYQAYRGACPWVDMGTAIACGFWLNSLLGSKKGERFTLARESVPRVLVAVAGGVVGGAITGLIGWTGANLFGY
jgi:hypothetical protein